MTNSSVVQYQQRVDVAALVFMGLALIATMALHLVPALFAGLLIHEVVHVLAPRIYSSERHPGRARLAALALLITLVAGLFTGAVIGLVLFFQSEAGSLAVLLQKLADIAQSSRGSLPAWITESIPSDVQGIKDQLADWLREHAKEVKTMSGAAGQGFAYALVGMVIGSLVSQREATWGRTLGPLGTAITDCIDRLCSSFRSIVFAQMRISALNTFLTSLYLLVLLPILGIHLPFALTLVLITFLVGLLPVIGNLISNTVIVMVSLTISPATAIGSLIFLVVIHKLEYFVNARIVGGQIKAAAWELLLAMLVMEATFGVPGVIAAPVFYAYIKSEITRRGLV